MTAPDSVLAAYVVAAVRLHGRAGADIGDEVDHPESAEEFAPGVWRVKDGWGTYYFRDRSRGPAEYVCSKMEDVLAADVPERNRGKINAHVLGMGDATWDAAVLTTLGEET